VTRFYLPRTRIPTIVYEVIREIASRRGLSFGQAVEYALDNSDYYASVKNWFVSSGGDYSEDNFIPVYLRRSTVGLDMLLAINAISVNRNLSYGAALVYALENPDEYRVAKEKISENIVPKF